MASARCGILGCGSARDASDSRWWWRGDRPPQRTYQRISTATRTGSLTAGALGCPHRPQEASAARGRDSPTQRTNGRESDSRHKEFACSTSSRTTNRTTQRHPRPIRALATHHRGRDVAGLLPDRPVRRAPARPPSRHRMPIARPRSIAPERAPRARLRCPPRRPPSGHRARRQPPRRARPLVRRGSARPRRPPRHRRPTRSRQPSRRRLPTGAPRRQPLTHTRVPTCDLHRRRPHCWPPSRVPWHRVRPRACCSRRRTGGPRAAVATG